MRALVLDRPGSPDTLRIAALPVPEPGPGEVRVKVEACGLNPSDYLRAAHGMPSWTWPAVLGLDVAGTVDALGPGVTDVSPGQRVAYHSDVNQRGGFAEYALATAAVLAPVPDTVDSVLITGGAGRVGGFAVQLAASTGAQVIATGAGHNAEHVRGLGAKEVIDYRTEDVAARVRELT
jgi:NADPH2:quinone reductase